MAGRKTAVRWDDRETLLALLRPLVARAGERCNLTALTRQAMDEIEAGGGGDGEWVERLRDGALFDFLYVQIDNEMKRQKVVFIAPKTGRNITLNPRQGVRRVGEAHYQQVLILSMTREEYLSWRNREIAEIQSRGKKMQVIRVLDELWAQYADAATLGDLLQCAGLDSTSLALPAATA